jgi:hypothetical protein
MSLSVLEVGAYLSAGLLAATRLLSVAKPLWDKLPRVVAVALPVVVASLPLLAEKAGLIKTEVDLVGFGVTALALLVPGIAEAEKDA